MDASAKIATDWLWSHMHLVLPFLLALLMAWCDLRTRRIPNILTFGGALAGLSFQVGLHGLNGLLTGFLGLVLGFVLLFLFYLRGGMGAGDVKALAALGAWLGVKLTLYLFIYMGISGLFLLIIHLWYKGVLWHKLKEIPQAIKNWILLRPFRSRSQPASQSQAESPEPKSPHESFPYGTAMAAGMAILLYHFG